MKLENTENNAKTKKLQEKIEELIKECDAWASSYDDMKEKLTNQVNEK